MQETPIKVLRAIQEERPKSLQREVTQRNSSEIKFNANFVSASSSKKFSFKTYIKTQISKENETQEQNSKYDNKNAQTSEYVQQLIDMKLQIQKTNFLNQYQQKYFISQDSQKTQNCCQQLPTARVFEILNGVNSTTQSSIENLNKKISLHQSDLQTQKNQHFITHSQQQQQLKQYQKEQQQLQQNQIKIEKIQKSSIKIDQTSQFSSINNTNDQKRDVKIHQSSTYSVLTHNSINKLVAAPVESIPISKNMKSDRQFQSVKTLNSPETQVDECQQSDQKGESEMSQKQSERENTIKKQINKKQIVFTQNTVEDLDDEGYSSGEEFDLNIIPKSRLIFKINQNAVSSSSNFQTVQNHHSRQSLDINYLSAYKSKLLATEEDESPATNQSQKPKSPLDLNETVSQKLKQIVAKRKFASENIQQQQIKNLRKLIPQAFQKAPKRKRRTDKSPVYRSASINRKPEHIEEMKTINSHASTNHIPISSEETDIDMNEILKYPRLRQSQNRSSSTSIYNHLCKEDITASNSDRDQDKLRIVAKGIPQKPQRPIKQGRSQSVNSNFGNKKSSVKERDAQEIYPMINVLLCSNRNADCSERYKDLSTLLSSLSQQDKQVVFQKTNSSSFNNLSNQTSNQNSSHISPLSFSNQEIPQGQSPPKEHSEDTRNASKRQTVKFGQIKHLLQNEPKSAEEKNKFVNYHLLFKERVQSKDTPSFMTLRSKRSQSTLKSQYNSQCSTNPLLPNNNSSKQQLLTTDQNNNQVQQQQHLSQQYPIKVQTLIHVSNFTTPSSYLPSHQSSMSSFLKNQIKNLKQINPTHFVDRTSKNLHTTTD